MRVGRLAPADPPIIHRRMEAFLLNQQLHWYPIRRFGASENRHYNLDSCIPSPEWISPTYLGMWLREAEMKGMRASVAPRY